MRLHFLNSAVIANSKMDYSKLVRENDGRIKTKDNANKFNFMVKYARSCSDVLVLFLLLMLADLQENMLISVRCQTRLHIIGATVVAEETGGVAPRTGKMVQTYGIWC